MIVDDDAIVRKGLAKIINWKALGSEIVFSAGTGRSAIDYIEKNKVDVILSDVKMPDVDGLELAQYIHEKHSDILVILISAYSEFEYAQKAIRYNVKEYLTKPINAENIEHIKRIISDCAVNKLIESQNEYWNEGEHKLKISNSLKNKDEDEFMRILELDLGIETNDLGVLKKYYKNIIKNLFSVKIDEFKYLPIEEIIEEIERETDEKRLKEYIKGVAHECFEIAVVDKNSLLMLCEYIVEIIEENYANQDLNVNAIASKIGLNSKYVGTIFRATKGVSVSKYINSIRMEKSKELLETTDRDIKEISQMVGYSNYRYFVAKFKKDFNCTPTEYRKNKETE